jgi:hypothetical protein
MRIVIGHHALVAFSGSETYLLTVAQQLERLGHDVTAFVHRTGDMTDVARERGLHVVDSAGKLPSRCDAVLAQDAPMAYELADRYPAAPRVYVAHSAEFLLQAPPQLPEICQAVVVLNNRVGRRVEALAQRPPLVRLRQPIDLDRFGRFTRPSEEALRVLVLGNSQGGARHEQLERCCRQLGMTVSLAGRYGEMTPEPETEIRAADIVVGIGRCVVEAMVSRKAAYVRGIVGGDGWVTPGSYPVLESDGFSGRATDVEIDEERLLEDLSRWEPEMGERNSDIARRHHDAADHAAALVALWERLGSGSYPPATPAEEIARLVRLQAQAESRVGGLGFEVAQATKERKELTREVERLRAQVAALKATRKWRFAQALGAPLDRARTARARLSEARRSGRQTGSPPRESQGRP